MKLSAGGGQVGKVMSLSVFLTNCLNCFEPNKTSQYFGIDPPTIEQYLQ